MPVVGANAAYGHAGIYGTVLLQGEVGKERYQIIGILDTQSIKLVANEGVNCNWHILHGFGAFLRRYDDFFELTAAILRVRCQ